MDEWAFKLVITSMVAVIAYFLKRSLDRIEGKLDAFSATQTQHALLIDRYETRLKHMEEKLADVKETVRELSEGWIK